MDLTTALVFGSLFAACVLSAIYVGYNWGSSHSRKKAAYWQSVALRHTEKEGKTYYEVTRATMVEVDAEADRAQEEWGIADWSPEVGLVVLTAELGEVSQEVLLMLPPPEGARSQKRPKANLDHWRSELMQVAAVAVRLIEAFDAKRKRYDQS
jgi:hypothetical protein